MNHRLPSDWFRNELEWVVASLANECVEDDKDADTECHIIRNAHGREWH